MLIWSRNGILIPLIGLVSLLLVDLLSRWITGDATAFRDSPWSLVTAWAIAAAITYALRRPVFEDNERVLIDKETGEEVVLRNRHSFFFIPAKWWPIVFLIWGGFSAIVRLLE